VICWLKSPASDASWLSSTARNKLYYEIELFFGKKKKKELALGAKSNFGRGRCLRLSSSAWWKGRGTFCCRAASQSANVWPGARQSAHWSSHRHGQAPQRAASAEKGEGKGKKQHQQKKTQKQKQKTGQEEQKNDEK
jgi:hypothetical protein